MTHFTDIEIHRWREAGPGDDRERVVTHLATCADCAGRYAAAIRQRPLQAEPAIDVDDFAAAARRGRARRSWIVPLAAAAVLVIAITIPLLMRRSDSEPHLRGGGVVTYINDGQLAWSTGVAAAGYRVDIGDAGAVVFSSQTDHSRIAIPPQLKPGTYWWSVTALDAHGRPLATSPRRPLTIHK